MLKSVNINFGDSRKLRVTFTHEICCMPHSLCGNINNTVRIIAMILRFLVLHFPAQTFGFTLTKSPGMQASIIRRLSQARINWDGCDRKGIRWHKNGRAMEAGALIVRMGRRPDKLSVCLPLLSFPAP